MLISDFLFSLLVQISRSLHLLPYLLKLLQKHTKKLNTQNVGSSISTNLENCVEDLAVLKPEQLDYEDLEKLWRLNTCDKATVASDGGDTLALDEITEDDMAVLLHCTSILYSMSSDYHVKLQVFTQCTLL